MKKLLKYSLALMALALGFVACSDDDDYQWATISGNQVFFPNTVSSTVNLSNSETSFTVPINRYKTDEAISVPLELTDTNNLFTIPAAVEFAAGQSEATITVSYDPEKFEYNDFKSAAITIGGEGYTTPYGLSTYTFKAGVPLTWKSLGKCTFVDNWFGAQTNPVLYQCEQDANQFRIARPFAAYDGDDYFDMSGEMDPYFTFNIMKPGDVLYGQTITKTGLVYFPTYSTGAIHPSYNDVVCMLHASAYNSQREESFWEHSYVAEYEADGVTPAVIKIAAAYYMFSVGGWNYSQREDPYTTIYFPGHEPLDYEVEVTYLGKTVSPDDEYAAQFSITAGADVEEVKYAFVAGDDVEGTLNGILDGSIETESVAGSTKVSLDIEKAGTYSLVAVSYGGGEAQAYDAETVLIEMGGGETWKAVAPGVYNYGVRPLTQDAESAYEGSVNAVLYQSTLDESRYRIAPWASWQSDGLVFTWNQETNVIKANAADTGENYIEEGEDYGRIFFSDIATFNAEYYGNYPSTYKPDTKTFEFWGCYHFGEYWFGAVVETFQLDAEADAAKGAKVKAAASKTRQKRAMRRDISPKKDVVE